MPIFRKALPNEEEDVFKLYEAVKINGRENGTSDWDEDYPNREILNEDMENNRIFIFEDNGRIIAAISMTQGEEIDIAPFKWKEDNACFLVRLCVDPSYQGKGIGEIMMKRISEHAKSLGIAATHHLASVKNPAANRLYKRMGYHQIGQVFLYETEYYAYEMRI